MGDDKELIDVLVIEYVLDLLFEFLSFIRSENHVKIGFLEGWDNLSYFIRISKFFVVSVDSGYNMRRHFILYTEIPHFCGLHIDLPKINSLWIDKDPH
jgi:hypothetical protein